MSERKDAGSTDAGESAKKSELAVLVAEMRELGVREYQAKDGTKVVLGEAPTAPLTEEQEKAQQKLRDEREKTRLALKRRLLTGAAPRIGPPIEGIK